ncbi:iqgap-related protein [Exophiala xenobiotica]|nr:iqgap-related protein [Exophiala xenobiotica]
MSQYGLRRTQTDIYSGYPQRQPSTASTVSSAYSAASNAFLPSRTSTVTSTNSSLYSRGSPGHKRGVSEAGDMTPTRAYAGHSSIENSPDLPYRNARQTLRPLPQAPSPAATPRRPSGNHVRAHTVDRFPQTQSEDPFVEKHLHEHHSEIHQSRPHLHHALTTPHAFKAPDLQELQKSSTSHLRALSRFAQDGDAEEFGITATGHSVVGLHNRRQLKRTDSVAPNTRSKAKTFGWGERNWMDKQRQFLQAYEYLCHVGEAKEWIEDIIHKPIPPVVQLEEALRDGLTLAEIVQAFHPDQTLKIFRHTRLQYKHSDNIVMFFRFLEEVGLPDLFRFELIDLYEKKNIPKVIYCIHALSWLLYRKGMVDFRIGNLVGQLEFEHHELEQTQRGLDKAGISMPSFSGMGASFGAEPEPEPIETEDERIERELREHEAAIVEFQGQLRGALVRLRLSDMMQRLWDTEDVLLDLQSRIRGDWARQVAGYRLDMQRFATHLQASARGFLARSDQQRKEQLWKSREKDVLKLQSLFRAGRARTEVRIMKTQVRKHKAGISNLQAAIRGAMARRDAFDQYEATRTTESEVVKIQSVVRAKIQGKAYKSLTAGKNPPVGTLKGFVHLLNDSDFDFEEEVEFERLRKTVVQHVRQNELADQYITQLDIKIALLVKNKITLDEVVKHQRHFGGHVGALLPNSDMASKDPFDLKALNKTSRRKLEHYQELFFLLQTQPQYLARLFRRIREQATAEKECDRIKHLVMGLFGYAQKRREEYYLVKVIVRSIKEEVDCSMSLQDYLRTNSFSNKLFGAYSKSPKDRKFLRDVLGPLVKENIIDNSTLDLESDPLQIYLSAINNEELRTGRRSQRDPNVPREVAIRDPETRGTFIAHMQDLRDITDQFFLCLEDRLHRLPFGVRFVAQQTYQYLLARFPGEDNEFVLQLVGQWLWRSYLQPGLLEPEKFGVADRAMTQEQKRNLGEIGKVLNQAASGREFGGDNVYLQPLNNYIRESIGRFAMIWNHVISIPSAEEHYDIDEFNDLYAKTKPTLYIKMADIFSIHKLLAQEISVICPSQDDVLRDTLRELGSVQSSESELRGVSSSEISLTLNPKLLNAEDPDADVKALFTETKRCVLYIIRIQSGASLLEVLVKHIAPEDEEKWDALVKDEMQAGNGRRGAYADASTHLDISTLSYPDLKRIALENVLQLESLGRLTRANQYQDLLNTIAVDIRTKHRRRLQRQKELENVKTTLARLNEQAVYLEQQLKTYNDYIEQAMVTLQNKKGKKRFVMPFTKQWDHERELQRSGRSFKFGSYKYSARTLHNKGVLVEWRGYHESQWDRVDLTISSNEVGVFTIDGSSGNMMIPGANAQIPLDDLLQAQFNNTQFMEFFEGALRVNVNLFLHLIMKKFYNE